MEFWIGKIRKKIKYSIILRACMIIYTPICFATNMQFLNLNFDTLGNRIESGFSITAIVYLIFFPLLCFYILNSSRFTLEDEETKEAYGSIYDSVHTNALLKRNFLMFFLIRKALWPLFIVVIADDPLYQVFGLIFLVVAMITLLILKTPYQTVLLNRAFIFNEFLVLIVLILISITLNFEYLGPEYLSLDLVVSLGWATVGILSSVIYSISH